MTYTKLMKKGEVMEIGYMLPFGVSVRFRSSASS